VIIIRIWHKSLIPYLPRQQLLGQWRECCCIAKNIAEKGTPNHILVNRIMDYPIAHFCTYTQLVIDEMIKRNYKISNRAINTFEYYIDIACERLDNYNKNHHGDYSTLFFGWHNTRYLRQCLYNLEEKHDCQGITDEEWNALLEGYKNITGKDWEND